MNPHSLPRKRELGAYYTPPELSQVLADWAIRSSEDRIFEPSFGGCGFFESCIARLESLGCKSWNTQLYGVDIDKSAFDILYAKFGKLTAEENRFVHRDFCDVSPKDFAVEGFDSVIGNPPYVSMHNMSEHQKISCSNVVNDSPYVTSKIGGNVSLWGYFLLHSLSFMNEGGRFAWILPSSLLHADYSKKIIKVYKSHFKSLKIVKLDERFFVEEGAPETSVIFAGEGFSKDVLDRSSLVVETASDLDGLKVCLYKEETKQAYDNFNLSYLSEESLKSYFDIVGSSYALGDVLDIKIGMVTGANKYFIVDGSTLKRARIKLNVVKPVVSKFSDFIGIKHTKKRHLHLAESSKRVFLVNPSKEQMATDDSTVKAYLSSLSDQDIEKNRTFEKRPNWFEPDYGSNSNIPDAFFSYMMNHGPRMVINQARVNCTNSIHKVFFHDKNMRVKEKVALAVSLFSSFSQLSAEIEGRWYSTGVLKIEPSAGKRIRFLLSDSSIDDLNRSVAEIESFLKKRDLKRASKIVDQILIRHDLLSEEQCNNLASGVFELRQERYKGVKSYND